VAGGPGSEYSKQRNIMRPIYIVGAGGAAKEIFLLIKEMNAQKSVYDFKGFINKIEKEEKTLVGKKVFSVFSEITFLKDCKEKVAIVFGIGDPTALKKATSKFSKHKNFEFPNLVHPNVSLDESVSMGIGNIISSVSVFTLDITLGSFNYINRGVHVGHDCKIGSCNVLNPCAVISGGVVLEDENLIGSNATVLQYLTIGSKNRIGAGAVITKNVENGSCMVGVPAKNIK
jgi:sugar O-acyltransferase (sialic acid O-acetyltransferase NeuD family)